MATSFIHLHCHSNYSLLDSTVRLENLVQTALDQNMRALALTDTNNLYGAVAFYDLARSAGIHPVIGAEITLDDETAIVLLVKNMQGYENLCEIITQGNLQGGHLGFEMDASFIAMHAAGLICLSGGKKGSIYQHLRRRNRRRALHQAMWWRDVFREEFYLELQSHGFQDQPATTYLADMAKAYDFNIVATNDVHMMAPSEFEIWRVLRAVDKNILLTQVDDFGHPEQYFKSAHEMSLLFNTLPQALLNTLEIGQKCDLELSLGTPVFPALEAGDGETPLRRLQNLCESGLRRRYDPITPEIRDRLQRELDTISKLGFVEYFLIVKEIVDFCHGENIPCVGRGSAADSIVSYLLGITRADPIRYDLYFERFLNPERTDAPDIDLDICWKNRDRVLQHVYETYSHDKTALISTFVTFKLRSSLREVAKVMGLPEDEIKRLTRDLPHYGAANLEAAAAQVPECQSLALGQANGRPHHENVMQKIMRIAQALSDFPRHLSVHPGGTIIAPQRITRYTPLEIAGGGLVTSQHDMYSIERLGLVKMDLLGVRTLSVITDTVELTRERYGTVADINGIREDDDRTMAMIKAAATIGCFQLESPAMRGLLHKIKVENMDDVIASIALIRPGPSEGGMKDVYIKRRAGLEETTYPHPSLEPVLKDTYGIILYQEQVLLVAQTIAGLTLGEADVLRRAMTKTRDSEVIRPLRERFVRGAEARGIPEIAAIGIWNWLRGFVGYGFNKAHSATYGILAYQTAFLKCHFPLEYMTAVLNNEGGFYPRFAYIEEARRLGIKILPPDVNSSVELFSIEDQAIRTGLGAIMDLRSSVIKRLMIQRKRRPFVDVYDTILRCEMNEKEAQGLARCGAFGSLEGSEAMALTGIRIFFRNHRRPHLVPVLTRGLDLPPYPQYQRVMNELDLLRFSVACNPLKLFLDGNPEISCVPSTELTKMKNQRVTVVGWVITSRRVATASKDYMKFLTLEDLWGTIEVVLFPSVYRQAARGTRLSGPLQIIGKIQSRVPGEANLIAEKVIPLRLGSWQKVEAEDVLALTA